jgi:PAS domain S-box-containing protein
MFEQKPELMPLDEIFQKDIDAIAQISIVPNLLDVVCQTTGMGFAAVARVTEDRWITCSARDELNFGLKPGDELQIATTICNEIRQSGNAVIIDHVSESPQFCGHHTPAMYGFQSYISVPILRRDGSFFGTLCAIDPEPRVLDTPAVTGMFNLFADLISLHLNAVEEARTAELKISEERLLHKKIEETNEQLAFAIEAAELGTFDYDPGTQKFSANKRLKEWFGLPTDEQILLEHAIEAIDENDRTTVVDAIGKTLDYKSGGKYDVRYSIIHPKTKKETVVHAKGRAWFNDERLPYRFNGTLEDVTEQAIARRKIEKTVDELELFKFVVENISDFIGICDINFIPVYVNREGLDLVGLDSLEQMQKTAVQEFFFPEDVDYIIDDFFPKVLANGFGETEIRFRHFKTGETLWMIYNVVSLQSKDGRPAGFATVSKNITGRKNSEDMLTKTSKRLQLALDAGKLGSYELDLAKMKMSCTPQCRINLGLSGVDTGEAVDFMLMILPEDRESVLSAIEKSVSDNTTFNAVYRIHAADEIRWIHASGLPVYNADGKPIQIAGVMANITDQKTAEIKIGNALAEIKLNHEKLNVIINASELGTWELNVKSGVVEYSGKYIEFLGYEKDTEMTHEQLIAHLHPDDLPIREKAFQEAFATGTLRYETRLVWKDGSVHWIEGRGKVFYDADGSPLKMIGTIRDLTDEKTFSDKLEKIVRERTGELKENNEKLERMNKELQSFAYISSHDLQEPLRKIQTFTSWIDEKESQNLSGEGKQYFKRIQNAAERMQALIDDLLSYSQTDIADRKFEKADLNLLIEDVKSDLNDELEQKNAVVETNGNCEIRVIPFQFRQLIYNLVSNSLKFSDPEKKPVIRIDCTIATGRELKELKLASADSYCHIRVSDNGIGFEQQYADRIFELFQRLHGKLEYTGTGIGLAIVKKIVENHNGVITANARFGEGASFDIYLPLK